MDGAHGSVWMERMVRYGWSAWFGMDGAHGSVWMERMVRYGWSA
ncbi:hypothetical protein [Paenibacillus sp. A14]